MHTTNNHALRIMPDVDQPLGPIGFPSRSLLRANTTLGRAWAWSFGFSVLCRGTSLSLRLLLLMLFAARRAPCFLALALVLFAEGFGLEFVPVPVELFESVALSVSRVGAKGDRKVGGGRNILDSLSRLGLFGCEVRMLEHVSG